MQWSTPKGQEAPGRQLAAKTLLAVSDLLFTSKGSVLWEQTPQMVLTQGSPGCESEHQCYEGDT